MADITIQKQGEVFISQSEYDALRLAGNLQSNTKYHITKVPIDSVPTEGSNNLITSGGVFDALSGKLDASKNAVETVGGLVTPMSAPASVSIAAVDTTNAQTMLTIGDGLSVENGVLKATAKDGTEVVANPTGSATAELSKLQVGSSVYSIPKSVPYTLPVASATVLGGVKPVTKTSKMTQAVAVDSNGALYTTPTDLSAYYTGAQTDQKISAAVGAIQTNTFTVTENADGTVDLTIT